MIDFHYVKNSQATIAIHPNDHPYDSDLVDIDNDDRIIKFYPKPHTKIKYYRNLVSAAVYILSKDILNFIEKGKKSDFGRDLFPKISDKINMYGFWNH